MDEWQLLLKESELLAYATTSLPPIPCTFQQVAALAQRLRNKVSAHDYHLKEVAAARLMAREGLVVRPFKRSSKRSLVEPADASGQRRRKRPYVSSADQDTTSTAQQAIQNLLHRIDESNRELGPVRVGVMHGEADPDHLANAWTYSWVAREPRTPTGVPSIVGLEGLALKEQAYVDVGMRMVTERLDGVLFDAVGEFEDAASGVVGADEHLVACWGAVKAMAAAVDPGMETGNHAKTRALLKAARMFLESRSNRGMAKMVHESRHVINIGGDPSKIREIQNYVVYRHHRLGKFDFQDGVEGLNTSWAQAYFALRTGNLDEMLEAIKGAQWMSPIQVVKPFRIYIEEWVRNDGELSAASTKELMGVCRDLLDSPSMERRRPFFKYKILIMAFLCGNVDIVDELGMSIPRLWENLDEYLWFFVGCTRVGQDTPCFTLQSMQNRIQEYPCTHYSRNGKDPMLYTMVLIVTLQFQEAITFMAQDIIAEQNRSDAVHFALAFHHYGILDAGSSTVADARAKFGTLIESFGHQFSRTNSFLTLDYHLLGGEVRYRKPNLSMVSQALRKVLRQTGDHREYEFSLL